MEKKSYMGKKLTLIPIGGLANRIYAITSAICFCKDNNIKLRVIWFKDWGMGADFHDLFTLSQEVENVEIRDARWNDYIYDRPRKRNFRLPWIYQRPAFDSRFYEKELANRVSFEQWFREHANKKSFYVVHSYKLYAKKTPIDYLLPTNNVRTKINERLKMLSPHTIGIHIRRTDHVKSIHESPLYLFIDQMKAEIDHDARVNFYVASDSQEDKKALIDLFGDKIITQENGVRRDTKEGIVDALVELYILGSTKKIYGSSGSTYSAIAAEIKGIPIEILKLK